MHLTVDTNSVGTRAYFVSKHIKHDGNDFTFFNMINDLVREYHITDLHFAFDSHSFRHAMYPLYKSGRVVDPMRKTWMTTLETTLTQAGLATYRYTNMEADDICASLAKKIGGYVVTGDRDLFSIVGNADLIYIGGGFNKRQPYNTATATTCLGYPPKLTPDYKALVGDPSDNYFGVKGVGHKTAIKLLDKYGSFDNIVVGDLSTTLQRKFIKHAGHAQLSYELAQLRDDLYIELGQSKIKKSNAVNMFKDLWNSQATSI